MELNEFESEKVFFRGVIEKVFPITYLIEASIFEQGIVLKSDLDFFEIVFKHKELPDNFIVGQFVEMEGKLISQNGAGKNFTKIVGNSFKRIDAFINGIEPVVVSFKGTIEKLHPIKALEDTQYSFNLSKQIVILKTEYNSFEIGFVAKDINSLKYCKEGQFVTIRGKLNGNEWKGQYYTHIKGKSVTVIETPLEIAETILYDNRAWGLRVEKSSIDIGLNLVLVNKENGEEISPTIPYKYNGEEYYKDHITFNNAFGENLLNVLQDSGVLIIKTKAKVSSGESITICRLLVKGISSGNYLNGNKVGEWIYADAEHIQRKGTYLGGLQEGEWTYFKNGKINFKRLYKCGKIVEEVEYYTLGETLRELKRCYFYHNDGWLKKVQLYYEKLYATTYYSKDGRYEENVYEGVMYEREIYFEGELLNPNDYGNFKGWIFLEND